MVLHCKSSEQQDRYDFFGGVCCTTIDWLAVRLASVLPSNDV